MATMTAYPHGHFCWVDLMAKDMAAAKEFYAALFGWASEDQDTQGGPPYAIFTLGGQHIAGMGQMNEEMQQSGMPPVWNSYINVDDCAAATEKAGRLGATVTVPPLQVVEAGRMSVVQDPTGAFVSLWQKINQGGAQLVNEPGSWVWNELLMRDPAAAQQFYADLFGWTCEKDETSPQNYWIFKNGERMNGGLMELPPEMGQVPPHWAVYFAVEDINASCEKLKSLGGQVTGGPFPISVGHIAIVADAQGAGFLLIQMTVPADQ